jgi:hypothetical protein
VRFAGTITLTNIEDDVQRLKGCAIISEKCDGIARALP